MTRPYEVVSEDEGGLPKLYVRHEETGEALAFVSADRETLRDVRFLKTMEEMLFRVQEIAGPARRARR